MHHYRKESRFQNYCTKLNSVESECGSCAAAASSGRQMLHDIRDSLSHVTPSLHPGKINLASSDTSTASSVKLDNNNMQVKADQGVGSGVGGPGGVSAGNAISSNNGSLDSRSSSSASGGGTTKTTSAYRQKALAEIRNSLLPFANGGKSSYSTISSMSSTTTSGISTASCLSTASGSSSPCPSGQNSNGMDKDMTMSPRFMMAHGYDELKMGFVPMRNMDGYGDNMMRNSNEGGNFGSRCMVPKVTRRKSFDHDFIRGSPANLEGVATGSTRSDSPSCSSIGIRGFMDNPRLMNQQVEAGNHIPVSRQYSPSFALEPPPPPPPRPQVGSAAPSRGATPPLPPSAAAVAATNAQSQYLASSQVQQMLKRMSPVSQNQRTSIGYSSASQSSTPQRGTSPSGRVPVIAQNSQQIQHQLSQKLQNLTMYNGGSSVGIPSPCQVEPPPPYPVGSIASGAKMGSPLPYPGTPQSRQSPTLSSASSSDYNSSLSGQKRGTPQTVTSYPTQAFGLPSTLGANVVTSRPMPLSAWSTRQTPIIMQSVKSTIVQKPILQTAIAPTSPPSYASAIEASVSSTSSFPVLPTAELCTPVTAVAVATAGSVQLSSNQANMSEMVPTTDPPSYASSMQALAVQHAMAGPTATTSICQAALPAYNIHLHGGGGASGAADVNGPLEAALVVPKPNYPPPPPPDAAQKLRSSPTLYQAHMAVAPPLPPPSQQRKYSSPNLVLNAKQENSDVNMATGNVGAESPQIGGGVEFSTSSSNGGSTPPPPPIQKTTIQSPIPERKRRDKEEDEDDVSETKVKNYSPQAYKFFMEQHMENVFKSQSQRIHRRMQLENEMAKVELSDEARCQMRKMLHQKESNYIRLRRAKMDKSMFVTIKAIGVGAFGEVSLVFKIDTKQLYAMKTLRKADVLKRNQVAHVKAERDILAEADNEWVVKLYYSFQDNENLYLIMDYIPGGDLMALLIKFGIFENSLARFYIAELVCAIESVHKMGFIHRDIKPDNILIDRDGHIKLTDFGLCTGFRWTHNSKYYQRKDEHGRQDSMDFDDNWTNDCKCHNGRPVTLPLKPLERRRLENEHQRCLAHSLVGTPNYIAPEVLMRTGYTQQCDWWSVGVILYEMLVGQPPFLANSKAETQLKVINFETHLRIPKGADLVSEAEDLIVKLCTGHDKRLGNNGAAEVKAHPYFAEVDFKGGLRKQKPPYLPTILNPTDTSNFDPVDPEKPRNGDSNDPKSDSFGDDGKHPDHAFLEFTFRRFFDDGGHAYPTRVGTDNDGQNPVYV